MADEIKTVGTPSVSGPSGPSKAAPSVEYSSNALGKTKTVYDGNTPTQYNAEDPTKYSAPADPFLPSNSGGSFHKEKEHYAPCINPSCKSYGKSHPNCRCYAGPGGTSLENGMFAHGGQVGHYCLSNKAHDPACEHYEHPQDTLENSVVHHGLLHTLTKTGKTRSEDPNKTMMDHRDASNKGHKKHKEHMQNVFEKSHRSDADPKNIKALKEHLDKLDQNPEAMLDAGGDLPDVHAAQLGAFTGTATNYLKGLKPKQNQNSPLDTIMPVDKRDNAVYNRHLGLAENPMSILSHVKDGTLLPSDLMTLKALYPGLAKSMGEKGFEALVNAQNDGKTIPYKQKQSLSLLLGQPLDSTMSPQNMQAIIKSQGQQQAQQQQKAQKPKKASGVELNQLNKVNAMDATALQDRLMDKAKH